MQLKKQQVSIKHKKLDAPPTWWPKGFVVNRSKDRKHISGSGFVIHGVVFENGKTVICWQSTGCIAVFDSYQLFESIHLRGSVHDDCEVLWLGQPPKMEESAYKGMEFWG